MCPLQSGIFLGVRKMLCRRFLRGPDFCTKFGPSIIFSNDELHIILNRRNLEICEHSSFCQLLSKNIYKGTLKNRICVILVEDV